MISRVKMKRVICDAEKCSNHEQHLFYCLAGTIIINFSCGNNYEIGHLSSQEINFQFQVPLKIDRKFIIVKHIYVESKNSRKLQSNKLTAYILSRSLVEDLQKRLQQQLHLTQIELEMGQYNLKIESNEKFTFRVNCKFSFFLLTTNS